MGRPTTGSWTTDDARQIDLSLLIKWGLIKPGQAINGTLDWSIKGKRIASISIQTVYVDLMQYVRLYYTITRDGKQTEMNYQVELWERPSNLGIGKVLFFKCPVSQKLCRKLYLAYDSTIFKSREAYQNRLYYPMQVAGKLGMNNDRFWHLKRQIKTLEKGRAAYSYAGKITRRAARLEMLKEKRDISDWARWQLFAYPCGLRRSMERNLAAMRNED